MESQFATLAAECREFRRRLHRHPELSGQEFATRDAVAAELKTLDFEPQTFSSHAGIVAIWPGRGTGRCLGLRADMDALPLREQSGLPWASEREGVMHACGHDGHTSILLGVARWLRLRGPLPHSVKLIFQPSEEIGNGASKMIDAGALANPRVDAIFALHGWPELPVGSLSIPDRAVMAAADNFTVRLHGQGGHGAMPHLTRDPIVAAAHLISAAQTLVSRRVSPLEAAVITFGQVSAGETYNVIPEQCLLRGTLRSFTPALRKTLRGEFDELLRHTAAAFGVKTEIHWVESCPATVNHPNMAALARAAAQEALGPDCLREVPPSMGGEDFAFFLEQIPGAYFWLGLGMDRGALHNPRFDFNDAALATGIAVFAGIVERYFAGA